MPDHFDFMPPGKARGLLPRVDKPGDRCGFLRDVVPTIPMAEWPELLKTHTGLDPCVSFWLDQDGVGSCAAEACSNGLMLTRAFSGQPFVLMSPWSLYSVTSGGSDRGSNLGDNLDLARSKGVCPDATWPRSKGWRAVPNAAAYKIAAEYKIDEYHEVTTLEEAGTAMLLDFAFYYGSASHAKCGIKLLDSKRFKYLNSWGKDWSSPGAGEYIAEQLFPERDATWHYNIGLTAATWNLPNSTLRGWTKEVCRAIGAAMTYVGNEAAWPPVEIVREVLKSDEWSGRGVEKLSSSGVNFGYGAYCVRTASDAPAV